jgi:hypothetical protein
MTPKESPSSRPANVSGRKPRPRVRDRSINIEGMTGHESVSRVSSALTRINGLDIASVTVGNATLRSATRDEALAACEAIRSAGFEPLSSSKTKPPPE